MTTEFKSILAIAGAGAAVVVAIVVTYNVVSDDNVVVSEEATGLAVQTLPITPVENPIVAEDEDTADTFTIPSFDVVRVDKTGAAVVAGKAAANSTVSIRVDGEEIVKTQSDANGSFVTLFDLPVNTDPRQLSLTSTDNTGVETTSVDQVLIMPVAPEIEGGPEIKMAPKIVVAKSDGVQVVKSDVKVTKSTDEIPTAETEKTTLSLDTIVYDDIGDVIIAGSSNSDDFIRIYLDGKPNEVQKVQESGRWKITLSDVPEGLYALRVDTIDAQGTVKERVESPFKKEATEAIVASSKSKESNVTIQPGFTLWELAENRYGNGRRYVQIFEANRDLIKDPNLIYPGQIFDLPTQ